MEEPGIYFGFLDFWWFYAGFTLLVLVFLAVDLGVFHRQAHVVGFQEAVIWSIIWIVLALVFNLGFYWFCVEYFETRPELIASGDAEGTARRLALEFLAGYVVEKSLSVDNIFVFVVVFRFFGIPLQYQHRVLFFGILGALFFRAVLISAGAWLMGYWWMQLIFGLILVATGIKMMFRPDTEVHPERNPVVNLFQRFMPVVPELHGQRFFVRVGRRWCATPLMLTLVFVEATDIIFAFDSVPAIYALTSEPMIVYTSNVFAILGLRALYFLLAGAVERFSYLHYGLAVILIFVGLKLAWLNRYWAERFHEHFPISWSLGIIGVILAVSVAASLLFPPREEPALKTEGNPDKKHPSSPKE